MEQIGLALRSVAQKLSPYFQAHQVTMLTNQPLRSILHEPDLFGRMLKWVIELSEYEIKYQPKLAIKRQVMADFIAEIPQKPFQLTRPSKDGWWISHVDGASWISRSRVGLLLQSPIGEQLEQVIQLGFPTSNNEAKYEVILSGLDLALALSASKLEICSDFQLIIGQVQEDYEAKDGRMAQYLSKVRNTLDRLNEWAIKKISHIENVQVEALVGRGVTLPIKEAVLLVVHLQTTSSIAVAPICNTNETSLGWAHEIENYLRTGNLLEESKRAHKIRVQVARFTLIGDCLYRRSFGGPYLRCLDNTETQYVLVELHEGVCGNHTRGRTLAHRAYSQEYYWPTMKQDVEDYVKRCDWCQRHAPIPRMPSEILNPITSPWSFTQ
ncbi:uncharacterized protein LOC117904223 [Vitis riparia]|uniref:uncharacterized protein LOC117904223 n=1 Tax=Vitis riparia TaxID=96939 RepID=UPI00155A9DBE|nr:uncharacterized protein LOC117904223 [Vitis riparia]